MNLNELMKTNEYGTQQDKFKNIREIFNYSEEKFKNI